MHRLLRRSSIRSAVLCAVIASAGVCAAAVEEGVAQLLAPLQELRDWTTAEAPRTFVGEDLFELIDGGAELYHEYGFRQAVAARFEGPSSATLQIEAYQMDSAASACGVYSLLQSPKGAPIVIGQGGRLYRDYLIFWKGPFYVSLTLTVPLESAGAVLTGAARQIADRIDATGEEPALWRALPPEGLLDRKYVRGAIALSNVYVFGSGNVFGVTEGVYGEYADHRRFVFQYATREAALGQLAAAAQAIANDKAYHDVSWTDGVLGASDRDENRVTARCESDRIIVQVSRVAGAH